MDEVDEIFKNREIKSKRQYMKWYMNTMVANMICKDRKVLSGMNDTEINYF